MEFDAFDAKRFTGIDQAISNDLELQSFLHTNDLVQGLDFEDSKIEQARAINRDRQKFRESVTKIARREYDRQKCGYAPSRYEWRAKYRYAPPNLRRAPGVKASGYTRQKGE